MDYLGLIDAYNGKVTSAIIKDLIESHSATHAHYKQLYERYKSSTTGVPIFSRTFDDENKVNNKLNNDFFSEIVDTKVGYMAGNPISYVLNNGTPQQKEVLQKFNWQNAIYDLDAETLKMASICGTVSRLLYIDKSGEPRVMLVPPWEAIYIEDMSLDVIQYALRYYTIEVQDGDTWVERTRVEWYDKENVYFYIEDGDGNFIPDVSIGESIQRHLFDGVPLVEFVNNEERLGDAEKVLTLIDAYDRTMSDVNSEIEQFRLAYMAFYGEEPDAETIEKAKQTGAFSILDTTGKIEFIVKDLPITAVDSHLDRLEANILRFAKSVNFADKEFTSNISGESRKFKLMSLENKASTTERKFTKTLQKQYALLADALAKKGDVTFDPQALSFKFTRNLPVSVKEAAETSAILKGLVPEEIRLSLLPFVEDVQAAMKKLEEETQRYYLGDTEK